MTPDLLLFFQWQLLVVSAFALYALMRRYQRQPALWPIPGIYCSLMLFYALENHFASKLLTFLGCEFWLSMHTDLEWAFWALVFLLVLLRFGRRSSKCFLGLAFAGGMLSIAACYVPLRTNYAIRHFFQLSMRGDLLFGVGLEAILVFCVFLCLKALCYKRNKSFQVSELALFAATNLGAMAVWFSLFSLFSSS